MIYRRAVAIAFVLMLAPAAPAEEPARHALSRGAPWQAQIYTPFTGWSDEEREGKDPWELAHKCGGSLIAPEWVLTAAHCINRTRIANGYRVRLGVLDLGSADGVTYRIDRMVRHGGYVDGKHPHDIALVHLKADELTDHDNGHRRIKPIALYDGDRLADGTEVTVIGWGKDEHDRYVRRLQQADLATSDCSDSPDLRDLTDETMLCAGAPDKDACKGDSGGPLVLTWGEPKLVGIVSWGIGCGEEGRPGVYVRLDNSHYLDWIRRAMEADPSIDTLD
ncbi:MAG TPA: serine protease [Sphingomicrobium sp.]|nr:serine protease [Sphingomicrobium sp.]